MAGPKIPLAERENCRPHFWTLPSFAGIMALILLLSTTESALGKLLRRIQIKRAILIGIKIDLNASLRQVKSPDDIVSDKNGAAGQD